MQRVVFAQRKTGMHLEHEPETVFDEPYVARAELDGHGVTAALNAAIAESIGHPVEGDFDAQGALSPLMAAADPGKEVVGYVAVTPASVVFSVSCVNGAPAHGTLATWLDEEVGILECGLSLADESDAAREARSRFCTAS
ncbi:hypothetical protein [Xylanimonas protaetiae]|uniref:Uncharacterized protein n=1 Tax=Xylanimonas protaetiae TaxID=2509457 RepID=A0A4P6F633_9MICO|nr:hypothetical protein [Xylanimonas protaetiae]QAY71420.1 hypothetical protein ET471_16425 [Xylanimonas protaetiae]